ncbi:MAG: DJ-1/PfpI family protein, partial [Bacteroidota bacterium]
MQIVIYIYSGMTMLDAIGPYEVLRGLKKADIKLVAKKKGKVISDSKFVHLDAQYGIDEIDKADILLIPGSGLAFIQEAKDKKVLNWIRKINETTQKTVTVCTGSIILAATGLLQGKQATTHWGAMKMLEKYGVTPVHERYIEQEKFITAAGVSAGIDMAIYLVH